MTMENEANATRSPDTDRGSGAADGGGQGPALVRIAVVFAVLLAVLVSGATSIYLAHELSDAQDENRALAIKAASNQETSDDSERRQAVVLAGMKRLLDRAHEATSKMDALKTKTQTAVTGMQTLLADTQAALDSTNQTIAATNEALATTNQTLADANDLLDQADQAIAKMQGAAGSVQGAAGSLQSTNVADLGSRVKSVQVPADAVKGRFRSMSVSTDRQLAELRASIDALPEAERTPRIQNAVTALVTAVSTHRARVTSAIDSLQSSIADLRRRINALERLSDRRGR